MKKVVLLVGCFFMQGSLLCAGDREFDREKGLKKYIVAKHDERSKRRAERLDRDLAQMKKMHARRIQLLKDQEAARQDKMRSEQFSKKGKK